MTQLQESVALVTGASRGAGRGIALELGAAGATVYVTGRSVAAGPTTDNVPGTVDDTARRDGARWTRNRGPVRSHGRRRRGIAVRSHSRRPRPALIHA